jgi:hypothetical protein
VAQDGITPLSGLCGRIEFVHVPTEDLIKFKNQIQDWGFRFDDLAEDAVKEISALKPSPETPPP